MKPTDRKRPPGIRGLCAPASLKGTERPPRGFGPWRCIRGLCAPASLKDPEEQPGVSDSLSGIRGLCAPASLKEVIAWTRWCLTGCVSGAFAPRPH